MTTTANPCAQCDEELAKALAANLKRPKRPVFPEDWYCIRHLVAIQAEHARQSRHEAWEAEHGPQGWRTLQPKRTLDEMYATIGVRNPMEGR